MRNSMQMSGSGSPLVTCFVVLFFLTSTGNEARASTIGLDALHGPQSTENLANGSWFATMRSELQSAGHSLVAVTDFSSVALAGVDFIFVSQARNESEVFTGRQIADIHDYVGAGKGLLAIAEGGFSTGSTVGNFDALLAPYGVSVNGIATEGDGHVVSGFVAHPVTAGLSAIGLDFQRRLVSINAPAIDLTSGGGPDDFLAVVTGVGGAGNVVVMSDPSPFAFRNKNTDTDIFAHDNLELLGNITTFFSIPEPSAWTLLGAGTLALLAFARPRRSSS